MQLSQKKLKPSLLRDKGVLQINVYSRSDSNIIKSAAKNRKHNNIPQECEGNRQENTQSYWLLFSVLVTCIMALWHVLSQSISIINP